jgi:hypothetical protein
MQLFSAEGKSDSVNPIELQWERVDKRSRAIPVTGRGEGAHIVQTNGFQMAVRLSALGCLGLWCNVIKITPVRSEVFTAVTMKNGVFWVVRPCGSCKNRRFGGT